MANSNLDRAIKYLDTIDLGDYLYADRMISDVMEEIDAIYGGEYENQTDSYLFSGWTEDDFANYIRNAYGVKCYERSILFIK